MSYPWYHCLVLLCLIIPLAVTGERVQQTKEKCWEECKRDADLIACGCQCWERNYPAMKPPICKEPQP